MHALALLGPRARASDVARFQSSRPDFNILQSPDPAAVNRALSTQPDVVILFGGDGTLNRHLSALVQAKRPVLMVPSGSGNDFAMANGIFNLADALQAWKRFQQGECEILESDLGILKTSGGDRRYFSCCANVGLDADATRRTNQLPNWIKARKGYLIGGLAAIASFKPGKIQVTANDYPTISEQGWFVAVSNTPTYGGGLKIAPRASIRDGQLDVTYLRMTPRWNILLHYPKIMAGTHVRLPVISTFAAESIKIETDTPQPVYADGEYIGTTPCAVSVAPHSLPVLGLK
jgi:diacylglycerol kinase (ATP)